MTNSADPDQLASEEANWSGSTLFATTAHVMFSKRRVNMSTLMQMQGYFWDGPDLFCERTMNDRMKDFIFGWAIMTNPNLVFILL